MKYILGLDQGGSKTHAAISDETGRILGVGKAHGGCHSVNGMEHAADGMLQSAMQACENAGVSISDIDRIGAGLTGVDWDFEGPLLQNKLHDLFSVPVEKIHVVNDCLIALRAASSKPSGCILCVGSAMNCGVRKDASHEYVYGYYIEDGNQGDGALAARVIQAVLDSESMLLPATALTNPVLNHVGCSSVDEMLFKRVNKLLPHDKVIRLPEVLEKVILETADPVAIDVLCTFGRDIARYVTAGLKRFDMQNDAVEIVFSGSVFKCRAKELQDTVRGEILKVAPRAQIIESIYEPIVGAVLLALDDIGVSENPEVLENIHSSSQNMKLFRK